MVQTLTSNMYMYFDSSGEGTWCSDVDEDTATETAEGSTSFLSKLKCQLSLTLLENADPTIMLKLCTTLCICLYFLQQGGLTLFIIF